jgi:predicted RNA-binding protein with TRAM domain
MVAIPDRLECLFSASVEETDDSYRIEVPQRELDLGAVSAGETYRVVIVSESSPAESQSQQDGASSQTSVSSTPAPPVSSGEVREVTIETLGDQGDGIAKIERGYVLIVPGARPDEEVTVEITQVRDNVGFAEVLRDQSDSESQ